MFVSELLNIQVTASLPACSDSSNSSSDSSSSSSTLYIRWVLYDSQGVPLTEYKSIIANPYKFILQPFSLQPNTIYVLLVTVSYTMLLGSTTVSSSSSSVNIITKQGLVNAIINGNKDQSVRIFQTIIIDGSSSYDDDKDPSLTGLRAGLLYHWECIQVG